MAYRLDHISFGVRGKSAGIEAMAKLGFQVVAGHCRWPLPEGRNSAPSASVMFRNGYLDFISYEEEHWPADFAAYPAFARGLAPSSVVLGVDDFDAALKLVARPKPYDIGRSVFGCDEEIVYRCLPIAAAFPLLLLHDSAPATMRTDNALCHPNDATALEHVLLRSSDLDSVVRQLEKLDLTVRLSAERVDVMGLGIALSWIAGGDEAPRHSVDLSELRFCVRDLDNIVKHLDEHEVRCIREPGSVRVPDSDSFGCTMTFASKRLAGMVAAV
jgi:hypothetical protein